MHNGTGKGSGYRNVDGSKRRQFWAAADYWTNRRLTGEVAETLKGVRGVQPQLPAESRDVCAAGGSAGTPGPCGAASCLL
jgi:hypothetical protein